jgi:hypothetical protein
MIGLSVVLTTAAVRSLLRPTMTRYGQHQRGGFPGHSEWLPTVSVQYNIGMMTDTRLSLFPANGAGIYGGYMTWNAPDFLSVST